MDNKEKKKLYRELNKEKIKEYRKQYYLKNKDKELEYQKSLDKKILTEEDKEKMKNYSKDYRLNNSDKVKNSRDKWKKDNIIHISNYNKEKRETDPIFKLKANIRTRISNGIKNAGFIKESKSYEILGCTFEEFKLHIESLWEPWMNWENYGNPKYGILELNKTWDIDHKIPMVSGQTEDEIIKLNHFSNLQPLCSYINRIIKRDN